MKNALTLIALERNFLYEFIKWINNIYKPKQNNPRP